MNQLAFLTLAALALTSVPAIADDKPKDPINDYLVNVGAGHVAANELIGLTGSAVSNLQTPKDLVAALAGLGDSSSKNGFGVAWAPGRSSTKLLGVAAPDYQASDLKRLWASTTFSYAQNTKTIGGANYGQKAAAINVIHYLNEQSDPLLAQYRAFTRQDTEGGKPGTCAQEAQDFDAAAIAASRSATQRLAKLKGIDGEVRLADLQELENAFKNSPASMARELKRAKDATAPGVLRSALETQAAALDACARKIGKQAEKMWNASHLDLVLGQAWIRSEAAAAPRISLGRHVAIALAWGLDDGLLNLTYRRVSGALDLDTLTLTPTYKDSSIAAARYTHRIDDKPGQLTYALAEISNAKANSGTTSNTAFKWALGVDRQIGENMWIEFRAGRARVPGGTAEENKALLSFKFSPDAGLLNAIKASGS